MREDGMSDGEGDHKTCPRGRPRSVLGRAGAEPYRSGQEAEEDDILLWSDGDGLGPAPDPRRGHYVIDPDDLRAAVGDRYDGENMPSEDAKRLALLRRLACDPDALWKPHLVADRLLVERLEAVRAMAPNAADAVDVVLGAARVSALTGTPVDIPPLLLLGPPGCGKTRLVDELAAALGIASEMILGSTMSDGTAVTGASTGWRGAAPSRIAEMLLRAPNSAALVFIDEVEKIRLWDRHAQAADILLGLLDRGMAARYHDQYLKLQLSADRAVCMLAANDLDNLSDAVLDRCLIVEVRPPTREEQRAVVGRIHGQVRARLGLDPDIALGATLADALCEVSLRRVGPAIQIALGYAVGAGRDRVDADDLAQARVAVQRGRSLERRSIGFQARH